MIWSFNGGNSRERKQRKKDSKNDGEMGLVPIKTMVSLLRINMGILWLRSRPSWLRRHADIVPGIISDGDSGIL